MKISITKIFKLLVGSILVFYVGKFVFSEIHSYNIGFDDQSRYKHLFSENYVNYVDTIYFGRYYRKSDSYYGYNCLDYHIGVIEIQSLNNLSLSSIKLRNNVNFNDVRYYPSYVFDSNFKVTPEKINYWKQDYDNGLSINLSNNSSIIRSLEGDNYWGFIGDFERMSFSRIDDMKHLMQFNFEKVPGEALFLFIKKKNKVYIIEVTSKKTLGIEVLDMFDLQ